MSKRTEAHARKWFALVRDNDGALDQPLGPRGESGMPYLTMKHEEAGELLLRLAAAITANLQGDVIQVSLPPTTILSVTERSEHFHHPAKQT